MQRLQLLSYSSERGVEPGYFIADLIGRYNVVRYLQRGVRGKMSSPYGDAAGNAHPVQYETHSLSPKRSSIRAINACIASISSAPVVSMPNVTPWLAASIMTPIMLFALTLRSLRDIHTSLRNCPARCVSFAEARACKPNLFWILTSLCCMILW